MGYYVSGSGEMRIKKENLDKAYEALMTLQDAPDSEKDGGSYGAGGRTGAWYSWMPADLRTLPDTKAVFAELGFEVSDSDEGDLLIGLYDSKIGQEKLFVAKASPFIENGEYEWTGEDGEFWKWVFVDGKMLEAYGSRSYNFASQVSV
jgi:hypothetical protein